MQKRTTDITQIIKKGCLISIRRIEMLEKCKISGFADEIDSSFDVQLRVLKELGQKFLELRGADGVATNSLTISKVLLVVLL